MPRDRLPALQYRRGQSQWSRRINRDRFLMYHDAGGKQFADTLGVRVVGIGKAAVGASVERID
jgi:hypothetical protein